MNKLNKNRLTYAVFRLQRFTEVLSYFTYLGNILHVQTPKNGCEGDYYRIEQVDAGWECAPVKFISEPSQAY